MNTAKVLSLVLYVLCAIVTIAIVSQILIAKIKQHISKEDGALKTGFAVYFSGLFLSFTCLYMKSTSDFSVYLNYLEKVRGEQYVSQSLKTGSVYIILTVLAFFIAKAITQMAFIYLFSKRKINFELVNDNIGYVIGYSVFLVCASLLMVPILESILISLYPTIQTPYIIN